MNRRVISNICIVSLTLGVIIFFQVREYYIRSTFYKSTLNNKIIELKHNWSGNSLDHVMDNGIIIKLIKRDQLHINDSIVKQDSTWVFRVYRDGKFLKELDLK